MALLQCCKENFIPSLKRLLTNPCENTADVARAEVLRTSHDEPWHGSNGCHGASE